MGQRGEEFVLELIRAGRFGVRPCTIDRESGTFIYFGDNKRPGRGLHETLRFGNELLRRFFEHAHSESTDRHKVPPIFVFAKTGEWRDVRFIGLAVPGGADIENYDDLVARIARGKPSLPSADAVPELIRVEESEHQFGLAARIRRMDVLPEIAI